MSKVLSFAALEAPDAAGVEYDVVMDAYGPGQHLRLGSVTSQAMISWMESRKDAAQKGETGLRLIVKSVVDEDGNRLPDERADPEGFEKWLAVFRAKDSRRNSAVLLRVFKLNGMEDAAKALEQLKNASGETSPVVSPIASPSPSDVTT